MAKITGWTGKILRVNLTTGAITTVDTMKYKDLIGGAGIGYKVIFDEVPQGTHPHDEANKIYIGVGPLTGTGALCSGRTNITSLLPSNPYHAVSDSHMGGQFGPILKFAGWDGIIIEGKSDKPVWLKIDNDKVSIEDASHVWGKGTIDTTFELQRDMGPDACIGAIGQAGENLVHLSSFVNSLNHSGGGHGSIFGSKKLKAIGVRGTGSVPIADGKGAEWVALNKYVTDELVGANNQMVVPSTPQPWAEFHSPPSRWTAQTGLFWGAANPPVETGECPPLDAGGGTNKVGLRSHKGFFDLGEPAEARTIAMGGCHSCPIRCQSRLYVPELEKYGYAPYSASTCIGYFAPGLVMTKGYADGKGGLETGNTENALIARALGVRLADDYGVWSNYMLLPREFAYCYKNGVFERVLPKDEYESIPWHLIEEGDPQFLVEFYRRIALKEGEFSALGMGTAYIVERWNLGEEYLNSMANNVWSKLGYPKHHANEAGAQVGALINTQWNRDSQSHTHMNFIGSQLPYEIAKEIAEELWGPGALDAPKDYTPINQGKINFVKWSIDRNMLHDSITMCNYTTPMTVSPSRSRNYRGDTALEAKYFSLATGIETSEKELDLAGERITTLHRALTVKNMNTIDMRNEHDILPEWLFESDVADDPDAKPFTPGNIRMDREDMEKGLTMLYRSYGWDEKTGAPTRASLERLGLKDVADELEKLNLLPK